MNNKEAIIEKIIADAQAIANENIAKAEMEVKAIEKNTEDAIKQYRDSVVPKGDLQVQETYRRKEMVTNLDCKKLLLSKKREIVDSIFDQVADYMRKNDKKGYIALISKMIEQNADDKDEVIICKKDEDIITKKVIDDIAKKTGKKISLKGVSENFDGGVILCGAKFDKNITFDLEYEFIKDEYESELAKILFGE